VGEIAGERGYWIWGRRKPEENLRKAGGRIKAGTRQLIGSGLGRRVKGRSRKRGGGIKGGPGRGGRNQSKRRNISWMF